MVIIEGNLESCNAALIAITATLILLLGAFVYISYHAIKDKAEVLRLREGKELSDG